MSESVAELAVRLEFGLAVTRILFARKMTAAQLAKRLDMAPGYVARVLHGHENLTLLTMAKIAMSLGCVVRTHVGPVEFPVTAVDYPLPAPKGAK